MLEARHDEVLEKTLDRLRHEIAELNAARKRLLLAADTDRRRIERELHEGVQQHLVALAVNLQLASGLLNTDRPAAKTLLEEMGRHVQQALAEAARLAQRIYPSLEAGGLATALRSAAGSAGIRITVEVAAGASYSPGVATAVYWCCLDALEGAGGRAKIAVREEEGVIAFEVTAEAGSGSDAGLARARDRVEALGGRLTVRSDPGGGTSVSGLLPLSG